MMEKVLFTKSTSAYETYIHPTSAIYGGEIRLIHETYRNYVPFKWTGYARIWLIKRMAARLALSHKREGYDIGSGTPVVCIRTEVVEKNPKPTSWLHRWASRIRISYARIPDNYILVEGRG